MLPDSPMRVAYVVKRYPRYSETFIVNEILAHQEAGLEVEIYSLRPPNDAHFQDLISKVRAPVTYLPSSNVKAAEFWTTLHDASEVIDDFWPRLTSGQDAPGGDVYQAAVLARNAKLKDITHLHAHFGTSAASVTRLASLFSGIPYTFTAHAIDIFHQKMQPDDVASKLRDAASVITVSDYNVKYLRNQYGSAADRVVRVYNGLNLYRFPYQSPLDRPALIVGVGRLIEKKGFGDLIDACAILRDRGRDFQCQIVGIGSLEPELRQQIDRLGFQETVHLLGPRPQKEVVQFIQQAAVFAAPCVIGSDGNRDGLPTVLLEAMALGTPCVATDVTGIPEVIRDHQTGRLVGQHDPNQLADALEKLLDDGALREKLARQARTLIEEEFDCHHTAAMVRSVFQESARDLDVLEHNVERVCI